MTQDLIPFGAPEIPAPVKPETILYVECVDCGRHTVSSLFHQEGCIHCNAAKRQAAKGKVNP